MITAHIKRLWQGNIASVRDYIIKKALEREEDLRIVLEGTDQYMHFTPLELRVKKFQISQKRIESKINPGQYYLLVDFIWKPEV